MQCWFYWLFAIESVNSCNISQLVVFCPLCLQDFQRCCIKVYTLFKQYEHTYRGLIWNKNAYIISYKFSNAAVEMAQLICGGCRTLLMYTRNADTVRCSCCSTVNLVRPGNANSASYSGISCYELSTFMLLIHRHFNLSEECGILLIYCW